MLPPKYNAIINNKSAIFPNIFLKKNIIVFPMHLKKLSFSLANTVVYSMKAYEKTIDATIINIHQ